MEQHPQRFQRAISSIVALVVMFGIVPIALLRVSRARFGSSHPLAEIAAPWNWSTSEISNVLSEPLRDDAVVNLLIRSSLTIVWVALAVIAVTTLAEVVHMIRHRGMPSPDVRWLGWAQGSARWLAVGIIAVLPLNSFSSTATAIGQPLVPVTAMQHSTDSIASATPIDDASEVGRAPAAVPTSFGDDRRTPSTRPVPADADTTEQLHTHTVQRGESIFAIAADYANGDLTQTNQIADAMLDLNLNVVMNDGQRFTNPALVQPGWNLTLPSGIGSANAPARESIGSDRSALDDDPTPIRGTPRVSPTAVDHTVEVGDTLSGIAERYLGDSDAWPELWEQNSGRDMGAGRSFDDPNLILPGWGIHVVNDGVVENDAGGDTSTEGAAPRAPTAERPELTDVDQAEPDTGNAAVTLPDTPPPTSQPIDTGPTTAPTAAPAPAPDATTPAPTIPTPSTSVAPAQAAGDQPGDVDRSDSAPTAPSPLHIEHAALLAAGVLTLVGVRRRRALRAALPHARVPTPPPEVAAIERRLRTIDPGERAARVDIAARAAAHHVAETGVQIGIVRAAPDGELVVNLTGPTHLDAPWAGSDRTWVLPASVPIELLADDARRAGQPCLALTTIGLDDDGRDVLLDLEAAGLTTIEATPTQGDQVVRAIGAGLATSLTSEVVHLVVADLGTDMLFDHPNTRCLDNPSDALSTAAQIIGSTLAHERTAFDLRTRRTGGEMWEPAVVLLGHSDNAVDALADMPSPGHGIAAVAAVDPRVASVPSVPSGLSSGATVRAHADRWELVAFGEHLDIEPIGITANDVNEIAAVLEDASTPAESNSFEPGPFEASSLTTGDRDQDLEQDRSEAAPLDVVPHDIVVSLMGAVTITDRHGASGTFERSKTVELIAWLATHRELATRTAARTALWELDVRDATFANVVSEARRALARLTLPPDGEEWLARTLNESLPLHERVVTDIDLIRQRVEHAQLAPPAHAIDVLRPAVEMVRGLPFAGTSYLWPDADGLTSNFVLLAITAAGELAAHALSVGDTELVFWATGQGLTVLPGHEELIGLRMRAHARAGDLAGVRQEWESYERVINADAWSDGEPAPKLLALRRELLTAPS